MLLSLADSRLLDWSIISVGPDSRQGFEPLQSVILFIQMAAPYATSEQDQALLVGDEKIIPQRGAKYGAQGREDQSSEPKASSQDAIH